MTQESTVTSINQEQLYKLKVEIRIQGANCDG